MSMDAVVARLLAAVPDDRRVLVAIDGVGASGKTTFAARLADRLRPRPVVVVHVDEFFHPPQVRHARGRRSPEGFWLDAYDYGALVARALTPLGPGGSGSYGSQQAPHDAIVLVEGTFLHRDELHGFWDWSIYLDVPFEEANRRMTLRDGEGTPTDRYVGAQRLYFAAASPWDRASLVVDNTDPADPRIVGP